MYIGDETKYVWKMDKYLFNMDPNPIKDPQRRIYKETDHSLILST